MTIPVGGETGRLTEVAGILDTDDLRILRSGVYFRVSAANFSAYVESRQVYVPQELSSSVDINANTTDAFCTGTLTANLIDPSLADNKVTIRSISGTTTLTADAGTVENDTLTTGQAVTLAPRSTGWFQV